MVLLTPFTVRVVEMLMQCSETAMVLSEPADRRALIR
jgi:hypothetical protein